jgi:hypothetical protein
MSNRDDRRWAARWLGAPVERLRSERDRDRRLAAGGDRRPGDGGRGLARRGPGDAQRGRSIGDASRDPAGDDGRLSTRPPARRAARRSDRARLQPASLPGAPREAGAERGRGDGARARRHTASDRRRSRAPGPGSGGGGARACAESIETPLTNASGRRRRPPPSGSLRKPRSGKRRACGRAAPANPPASAGSAGSSSGIQTARPTRPGGC